MSTKKIILQTILTSQLPIHVLLIFPLSFLNYSLSQKLFNWFGNNHMKANPGKCRLLLSTKSPKVVSIDGIQITSTETPLGITIGLELNFENHLSALPYVTR